MVTSASISIAGQESGEPFSYLERQLLLTLIGAACAALVFCVPDRAAGEARRCRCWSVAIALLLAGAGPGLGPLGERQPPLAAPRGRQLPGVRARARAGAHLHRAATRCAARRSCASTLRRASLKPLGLLVLRGRAAAGSSRTSARRRCCSRPASACCSWPARACATCWRCCDRGGAASALLARESPATACARLTAFLDPWADPFNSGFQLTQSLIAIGRGEWFGVGLGRQRAEAVLPARGAHRLPVRRARRGTRPRRRGADARAVPRASSGAASTSRACACDAGLKFQAYLAAGFGLWLGIQAFINIGVNMGVLPTKGLTLPLMSYGRRSLIVTLAWLGAAAARAPRGDMPRAARLGRRAGRAMSAGPVLIMAGGTGGHVFPALALARLLRAQLARGRLARHRSAGSRRASCPAEGIPIEWLSVGGLRGKGAARLARRAVPPRARAAAGAARSCAATSRSVVVGLGGFVTGPGGVAAWLTRRPLADPRAERHRRLHQPLPRAPRARGAGGLSRQLRARRARAA